MTLIRLTADQLRQLDVADWPVVFVDSAGQPAANVFSSFTPTEIAEAESRVQSPGPWYTTAEVLERLRSLDPSA